LSKPYLQEELVTQIAKVLSGSPTNVVPLDGATVSSETG
jgi:hypothetical protein